MAHNRTHDRDGDFAIGRAMRNAHRPVRDDASIACDAFEPCGYIRFELCVSRSGAEGLAEGG